MQIIPLTPTAAQSLTVVLESQNCTITASQKSTGMFLDLAVDNTPIISGVICRDRVRLVRQEYLGFVGDLAFMDTQGLDDPQYEGLGTRWVLMYLEASELNN